jgi:hypothetical protein
MKIFDGTKFGNTMTDWVKALHTISRYKANLTKIKIPKFGYGSEIGSLRRRPIIVAAKIASSNMAFKK